MDYYSSPEALRVAMNAPSDLHSDPKFAPLLEYMNAANQFEGLEDWTSTIPTHVFAGSDDITTFNEFMQVTTDSPNGAIPASIDSLSTFHWVSRGGPAVVGQP
jgi:hypothetical protein